MSHSKSAHGADIRADPERVRRRRYGIYLRTRFLRDLRRVVQTMRQLEDRMVELLDNDAVEEIVRAWRRGGVPWDQMEEANTPQADEDAQDLLDGAEDITGDVQGFLWNVRMVAEMLASHLPSGRR